MHVYDNTCATLNIKNYVLKYIAVCNYVSLLSGCLLEPRLCCEITIRDVFWSYIIKDNLFIVLLIEYVSSIRSIM